MKTKKANRKNAGKCIVCGGNKLKRYKTSIAPFLVERMFDNKFHKTDLLICENCSLRFVELRPNEEEMYKLYKDYRGDEYQKQRQKHEPDYSKDFNNKLGHDIEEKKKRIENLSEIIQQKVDCLSIKNVLDFGGDEGQFIPNEFKNAKKFVYDVSGVKPIEGINSIVDEGDLKNYQWDFVMCCHVLEHVSYPMEIINKIFSLIKPEGYLYIELPNEPIEKYQFKEFIRRPRTLFEVISNKSLMVMPKMHEHINFFDIKTLEYIFSNLGCEILNKQVTSKIVSILIKRG